MDYFAPEPTREEEILRRIKGNYRRDFVRAAMAEDGIESTPEAWTAHAISEGLKGMLSSQHPRARGGEDLPDLEEGEVEIARLTLADSVHGEVTSLRARPDADSENILLRMVDEYETEFALPSLSTVSPLSSAQVVDVFKDAKPNPTDTECEIEFQSFFYDDLNTLAKVQGL